ncbi:winged helix-turn-helix domain-containing protein [Natronosalvus vescus]|uniref:winged helix-turn-helix domain-containing protein n=1 Tax=Natronosalvus vescus TaxID=2953881 RepID=UPI0020912F67|nr:winged helix-turn-helix domain-containing protein [Natronosalvus vescus]
MDNTEKESTARTGCTTPSLDLVFELLADRRRRKALYYLHNLPNGVATVEEIAEYILTHDSILSESSEGRHQLMTALHHIHLPKLEEAGVIEHDPRSQTVRYWTQPSLEEWLEHAYHKECVQ